jgi:hypothetical protein
MDDLVVDDLVALVVGVAAFPKLPDWDIANDCTVNDAKAVATSLRRRGVPAEKIKLLLSAQRQLPEHIEGIQVHLAHKEILEEFITYQLGAGPFRGKRFFFFWSGHGVTSQGVSQTLLFTADSFKTPDGSQRLFKCLGLEEFRSQLLGMASFEEQTFCVNACRTPIEWSLVAADDTTRVKTLRKDRSDTIRQARFFAVPESKPAPVEGSAAEFSNGFARAVRDCIDKCETWPPNHTEWQYLLRDSWPQLWSPEMQSVGSAEFKPLRRAIRGVDREEQQTLVSEALKRQWKTTARQIQWHATVVDFHSCTSDCLSLLMTSIEESMIKSKAVAGGIHRVGGWPVRKLSPAVRRERLIRELSYRLTDDWTAEKPDHIVDALTGMGPCLRVVFVEIAGPCNSDDQLLVEAMLDFWKEIITTACSRLQKPTLPLLIIGHVDPEPSSPNTDTMDTMTFYRNSETIPGRRLSLISGHHLRKWLDVVAPAERFPWRDDLEAEIARGLGGALIEDITGVRMARLVDLVAMRADGKMPARVL